MLLLDIMLSTGQLVIGGLGIVVVTAFATYFLVRPGANTEIDCSVYDDPNQVTLNPIVAKHMISNYADVNNTPRTPDEALANPGKSPSRSVWFSLKSIQKFTNDLCI